MSDTTPTPPEDPQPGYGQVPPPPDPGSYGAAPGYGQAPPPPPPGYGQMPPDPAGYGAPAYGAPAYGGAPVLADWPLRVYSGLIDFIGPGIIAGIFVFSLRGLGVIIWLAAVVWAFYNAYLNGSTGQSFGKKIAGTRVVRASDGQLIGGGLGIVRYIAHFVDGVICYIGFLFPLWDAKRQTLADKIMGTLVIKA